MNIRSLLGAFQTQPDQFQNLLGEYYDPKTAKMKWLGGTLQGLGMGLASGQPGAWASGLTQGGGQAIDDYRQQALLGMKVKQANEDRAYGREQDQWNRDYRVNRDKVSDSQWARDQALQEKQLADQAAWNSLVKARTMKGWQEENALKQGQSNAVNAWTGQFKSQGGDLFSPEMQAGLRAQGIQGVDPADTVKYRTAQPFAQAGDVGSAFGVLSAPKAAPQWKETTLDDGVYWVDQNNPTNRLKMGERPNRNEGEGRGFTQEKQLRSEYTTEAKPFTDLRTNYQRIQGALQDQTGASDIALVYSFMKMLDPTSVVREGEFATAANAGGVDAKVISLYNSALNGQKLSPQVRQEFQRQADRQFEQQFSTYQQIQKKYAELAKKNGLDPGNVAPDLTYGIQPGTIGSRDDAPWTNLPGGASIRLKSP